MNAQCPRCLSSTFAPAVTSKGAPACTFCVDAQVSQRHFKDRHSTVRTVFEAKRQQALPYNAASQLDS